MPLAEGGPERLVAANVFVTRSPVRVYSIPAVSEELLITQRANPWAFKRDLLLTAHALGMGHIASFTAAWIAI
jgi:hypothetical protein